MATTASRYLVVIVALAIAATAAISGADEPKVGAKADTKLVGTWKMVSAKYGGEEYKSPGGTTTLKHMTGTHYMWATYDAEGKVSRTAGGPYTFDGEVFESSPEYGFGQDFKAIKGKRQSYKIKVEGNKFYQNGTLSTGKTLEEVWERVENKK